MSLSSTLFRILERYASSSQFCRIVNMRNFLSGRAYRVQPAHKDPEDIYSLYDDDGHSLFVCRRTRFRLYRYGVKQRINRLAADYHLTSVGIRPNGLLIDCGANVGELGLWAREQGLEYIPFEPEPMEAACCDLNNRGSFTRRYALWKEITTLPFYSKPETADSSLFFMGGEPQTSKVEAMTLDAAIDITNLSQLPGTVVLKVEAEGAEPEVLRGASKTLAHVDYVTVDCGHERGVERAHTFVEVTDELYERGFRLQHMHTRRLTAMFRRLMPRERRRTWPSQTKVKA